MKRLVLSVSGNTIAQEDLTEAIRGNGDRAIPSMSGPSYLKDVVSELEKRMIQETLRPCKQNQLRAARALGLSRHGLIKKNGRYSIKRPN